MPVVQSGPLAGLQFPHPECGRPEVRLQARDALHVALTVQLGPHGRRGCPRDPSGPGSVQTAGPSI